MACFSSQESEKREDNRRALFVFVVLEFARFSLLQKYFWGNFSLVVMQKKKVKFSKNLAFRDFTLTIHFAYTVVFRIKKNSLACHSTVRLTFISSFSAK